MARNDPYRLERWDDIRYVLAVARSGSFQAAAQELITDQSTVSRRIRRLEHHLGVKLFDRHAHGMTVAPAGASFVDYAREMENAAHAVERHLAGGDQRMAGVIRITAPDGLATHWLTPVLLEFQEDHPDIHIELVTSVLPVDLLSREADIAIRNYEPRDGCTIAQKVAHIRFSLFAAPAYIEARGAPRCWDDLLDHSIIDHAGQTYTSALDPWHSLMLRHQAVAIRVNTSGAFLAAMRQGFGIGLAPNYCGIVATDLLKLDIETACATGIWLLTHGETNRNARVRAMVNFLRQKFRQDRSTWFR